eukprot:TRINITY_DN12653_c0_g3_i1.p2 TRINITY_DN12653_c0_g3~~TRINITY_DN12653_c0_g3_i1.p2  ORF type:complete len:197 (+),score=64.14 TRINITY_DN12653_c0_g3_i1:68-592(+)
MASSPALYGDSTPRGHRHGSSPTRGDWGATPSPVRRVTTGQEDYAQLEWLVEKMAHELHASKQREARVLQDVSVVSRNMGTLQATTTSLLRENASLKARLTAAESAQPAQDKDEAAPSPESEVPELCRTALHSLEDWFDDRHGLQQTIESQQQEITRLTSTVAALTQLLQHNQR